LTIAHFSECFSLSSIAILAGMGLGRVPDYVVRKSVRVGAVLMALDNWRLSIFGSRLLMLYAERQPNSRHADLHRLRYFTSAPRLFRSGAWNHLASIKTPESIAAIN
jgi:DNA-binding transcriptional LysR family regulator